MDISDEIMVEAARINPFPLNKNKGHSLSLKRRRKVFYYSGRICFHCGVELTEESFTVDHLIPLGLGGSRKRIENLVASCYPCNKGRGCSVPTQEQLDRAKSLYPPTSL